MAVAAAPAPPEGGYGWVIVGCYVANMACAIQLVQMMGLVLKDVFRTNDITDSQGTTILTLCGGVSFMLGVVAGPLIRRYGFRRVAAAGALLGAAGLALCSTARTFAEFILYFSLLMGIKGSRSKIKKGFVLKMSSGLSMSYPAYIVALNSYFRVRRTLATAVAMAATGSAAILTPQLISAAASQFGPSGAMLALAGVLLQTMIGAALLRPLPSAAPPPPRALQEAETPMLQTVGDHGDEKPQKLAENPQPTQPAGALRTVATFFDLELLRTPSFACLLVGTSLGLFADVNFVQFLPFVLSRRGFSTRDAADLMSVFGVTDTACRLSAPLLHRTCARSSRFMYAASLGVFVVARTALLLCDSYTAVMATMALVGATRGVNVVFLQLLIPDNVPIHRLASAQGLYLLFNGVIFMAVGPFMGWMVGKNKDYNVVIVVLAAMNALTLGVWGAERLVRTFATWRRGPGPSKSKHPPGKAADAAV
ncbi:Monocarboxylate transporter 1 [Frankliniella fusca]|uniref:Monocarboxylate transporter 1 n=1 Tax=Frankliniella fusca TaxID=407009 RepID=A0AAE1I5Y9_9NEOP|nr:Monocarboxylate transporter 1 [Frankliniella fusca]